MPGCWPVKMSKKSEQAVKKRENKNNIFLNSLSHPPPRQLLKTVSRVKTSNVKISSVEPCLPCLFDSTPTRSQPINVIVVSPTPYTLTLSLRNLTIMLICSVWFQQQHPGQKPNAF